MVSVLLLLDDLRISGSFMLNMKCIKQALSIFPYVDDKGLYPKLKHSLKESLLAATKFTLYIAIITVCSLSVMNSNLCSLSYS
jgi:hypothetical protein